MPASVTAARPAARLALHQSSGACSIQPGAGRCRGCSADPEPRTAPVRSISRARTPVVPRSRPRYGMANLQCMAAPVRLLPPGARLESGPSIPVQYRCLAARYARALKRQGSTTLSVTAVVGCHWGDEGKGKLIDYLAARADMVIRYNGGANAGHSISKQFGDVALPLVSSG